MPVFMYAATDSNGVERTGSIDAPSSAIAVGRLRRQGLEVSRIRRSEEPERTIALARPPGLWSRLAQEVLYPAVSGVRLKDLAVYYRQFATLVDAGLPLYQALTSLEAQTVNHRLKSILKECQEHVVVGGRLSDVMTRHRYVFGELQVEMVRAAEHGGTLDATLARIADYLERELELRRMISRLTMYPKLVLLSALLILGRSFFDTGMPAISRLIVGQGYSGGAYLMDTIVWPLVAVGMIYLGAAVCRITLFQSEEARVAYEQIKLAIPGLGKAVRQFALTRFGRAFAAMYSAGLPLNTALQVAGEASASRLLRRAVDRALTDVGQGQSVSAALDRTGAFPPMVLDMIRTGEQTGNLDTMMSKVSDYLEGEAQTRAHQHAHIFATAIYLAVAFLVGMAIVRFWSGYSSSIGGAG